MPQYSGVCAVRLRMYGGPLVKTLCSGKLSVDFTQPFQTVDLLAADNVQWDYIDRGTQPGFAGSGMQFVPFHFQLRNTGGQQVVPLSDPTCIVRGLIITSVCYGSSTAPDPTFAHTTNPGSVGNLQMGVDDGLGNAGSVSASNQQVFGGDLCNLGTSDTYSIADIQAIPILINARKFLGRVIDVGTPGQFTIEMAFSNGGNIWIEGVAICGSDVLATVKTFAPGAAGSFTQPVGFEAKAAFAIACPLSAGADLRQGANWQMGFGWSVKCEGKGCCVAGSDSGAGGAAIAASYQRSGRLCATVNPAGAGSVSREIEVTSWDATSIDINVITHASPVYYKILFLGGKIAANAGVFTQGDTAIPYLMKRPKGMIVGSIGKVTGTTVRRDALLVFGVMANPETGKFNTHNVNHGTNDAVNLNERKGQDLLGTGVPLQPVATVSSWLPTAAGIVFPENGQLLAHGLVESLDSEAAVASWPLDDAVLREHAYLLLGDDLTADASDPCGEIGDEVLVVACAAGTGVVGTAYASAVVASGGTVPYTFAITSGGLPSGLLLNPATGAITGTPIAPGLFSYTIQVTDANDDTATSDCEILIGTTGDCIPPPGASTPGSRLVS